MEAIKLYIPYLCSKCTRVKERDSRTYYWAWRTLHNYMQLVTVFLLTSVTQSAN